MTDTLQKEKVSVEDFARLYSVGGRITTTSSHAHLLLRTSQLLETQKAEQWYKEREAKKS